MKNYNLWNVGKKSLVNLLLAGVIALTTSCGTIAKFSAGMATGLGIHEGAHYVAAKSQGMNPEYNLKNPTRVKYNEYKYKKSNQKIVVSGAGLVGQTLAIETILNTKKIPKDDSYVLGILAFTIGDNLGYGLFPTSKEDSDVRQLDEAGIKKEYVQGALIAHSVFSLYRLMKDKDFKNKFNFLLDYDKKKERLEFKVGYRF